MKKKLFVLATVVICLFTGCNNTGDNIYDNLIKQAGMEPVATKEGTIQTFQKPSHDHSKDNNEGIKDDIKLSEKIHGAADGAGEKIGGFLKENGIKTPSELLQDANNLLHPEKKEDNKSYTSGNSEDRTKFDVAFEQNSESGGLVCVELVKVVDGDTLVVSLEGCRSYIRLIGINTPESVAPDEYLSATSKENTQEGKDASAFTKTILLDTKYVYLEFDKSEYDPYNRILAYVWLNQDKTNVSENMLNAVIIRNGQAEVMSIEPNTKYKEEFERLADAIR